MSTLITPPHRRHASFFVTTYKNLLMYWWAHLVILPVYVVYIVIVFDALGELRELPPFNVDALRVLLLVFGSIPIVLPMFAPDHWRLGFRDRELLVVTSLTIIIVIYIFYLINHKEFDEVMQIIDITFLILVSIAFTAINRTRNGQWRYFAAGGVIGLSILIGMVFLYLFNTNLIYISYIVIFDFWAFISFFAIRYSVISLQARLRNDPILPTPSPAFVRSYVSLYILALLVCASLAFIASEESLIFAIFCLIALFIGAYPKFLFNRHVAYWRELTRSIRTDRIADIASPFTGANQRWNWFSTRWIPKYLTLDNSRLFLVLSVIIGGVALPIGYVLYVSQYQEQLFSSPSQFNLGDEYIMPSFLDLMLLGMVSTLVLMFTYSVIWLVRNRSNYLVTHITAPDRLNTIANLTTQHLVAEFKQIARLLRLRQVENENLDRDAYNAFFVTSGIDQEFLGQLRETVSIDAANSFGAALGRIMAFFLQVFATLRLEVTAQELDDGRIEMAVTLGYRRSQTTTFKHIVLPENSLAQADEIFMRPIARGLALDLLVSSGQVAHLGTNQTTLDYFLRGLEASSKRNWWQAISYYRQALEAEKPERGTYSIGHYHLGAALIFQGSTEGLDHLYTAEIDGPPIPETQYMLALMLAHQYWDALRSHPNVYTEVVRRCQTALRLRHEFPEAHQLLGSVYYHVARGKERRMTEVNPKTKTEDDQAYYAEYQLAYQHFRIALRQHARAQSRVTSSMSQFRQYHQEEIAEIQRQMTITHQIGDALRGLKRFLEADSYYRDMMTVYPRNIRTLADLSKTYCLSQNWQCAEEFMWRVALNHDIGFWDADVAIHVGWAIMGGVIDSTNNPMDSAVKRLFVVEQDENSIKPRLFQISQGFQLIDYALHQRPRYINHWRQTNWVSLFEQVIQTLIKEFNLNQWKSADWEKFFTGTFDFDHFASKKERQSQTARNLSQTKHEWAVRWMLWITLRTYTLSKEKTTMWANDAVSKLRDASLAHFVIFIDKLGPFNTNQINYNTFWASFARLSVHREEIAKHIESNANNKQYIHEVNDVVRLQIAQDLYTQWKQLNTELTPEKLDTPNPLSFLERWAVDVYAETASLAARMLAESGAIEHLLYLTHHACIIMDVWQKRWRKQYPDWKQGYFTFSARVFDYQRVTLRAWKTYAMYQLHFNPLVSARVKAKVLFELIPDDYHNLEQIKVLEAIQNDLNWTRKIIHYHPLVMYMQARLYRRHGLSSQAIEAYERLLDLISPYDPKRHLSEGDIKRDMPERNEQRRDTPTQTEQTSRDRLRYMEQVSGRQQFSHFIDRARIHMEIANTYERKGELQEAIQHLLEALRWSPNVELDIENFLKLGGHLNNIERYQDAQAIVTAVRELIERTSSVRMSPSRRRAVDILECVVQTRGGYYGRALENAKSVAQEFEINFFEKPIEEYIENVRRFSTAIRESPNENVNWDENRSIHLIALLGIIAGMIKKDTSEYIPQFREDLLADEIARQLQMITNTIRDYSDYAYLEVRFPQVFRKIINACRRDKFQSANQVDVASLISPVANIARYSLRLEDLAVLFQSFNNLYDVPDGDSRVYQSINVATSFPSSNGQITLDFSKIILSQIIWKFSQENKQQLVQLAELCNTLAFARAQMGLHIQHAYVDSTCAIVIMNHLLKLASKTSESYQQFQRDIAQYYDTMGWVYFRDSLPRSEYQLIPEERYKRQLIEAEANLRRGARYDQRRAIIHYHLAEVYHSRLLFRIRSITKSDLFQRDFEAQQLLEKANEHLGYARNYDQFRRLHNVISSLASRLAIYQPSNAAYANLFTANGRHEGDSPRPE